MQLTSALCPSLLSLCYSSPLSTPSLPSCPTPLASPHLLNLTEDPDLVTAQLGGRKLDGALRQVDEAGGPNLLKALRHALFVGVVKGEGEGG